MARELTIREAVVGDVTAIQRVARASWYDAYIHILGVETVESFLADWYEADGLRENVSNPEHEFLVAARGGAVIGFAHACPRDGETSVAMLPRLYVTPDHWSEGIGGTLIARIEYLLDERGFDRLRLRVLADNAIGVSFYESTGFERIEESESKFGNGTFGEYVYEKAL